MKILKVQNLTHSYNENKILKNINLELKKEETVAIIGNSGVGKSTLFNLISGIIPIQQGNIYINGREEIKGKVSYMLQKDLLLEHKTVINNIILPLIIKGMKKTVAKKLAEEKLIEFNLDKYKNKYPSELSGGMRQRVSLIRTAMFNEPLFLLDESFSALDYLTKTDIHKWYKSIRKQLNLTTLLITHDIEEAIDLSDRIYILKNKPAEVVANIEIKFDNNKDYEIQKLEYKKKILDILKFDY